MKEPITNFFLNILFLISITCLHIFITVMSIITLFMFNMDKGTLLQVGQTLIWLLVTFSARTVWLYSSSNLRTANKLVLSGIFHYNGDPDEDELKIKRKRINQIRITIGIYTKLFWLIFLLTTFLTPIMKWAVISNKDPDTGPVNPYLPQPIYMPFETKSYFGFGVAFLSNMMCFFSMFASFIAHVTITISYSFQLTAQIEVLSHSLKNIEKRAYARFIKGKTPRKSYERGEKLYDIPEYQQCLFLCLKENIIHHNAILR